jgi:glucokinase
MAKSQGDRQVKRASAAAAAEAAIVVGIDIGGTKTALMATEIATGKDLGHNLFPTPADEGPDRMVADLVDAVQELVERDGRRPEDLKAIGLAVPGQVVRDAGRIIEAGNLAGWQDVPLRDVMTRALGVPTWVEQDANAAALGERWRGAAKEMNNYVFLALGTGIGAGVVINGRLHRGFHNAAGEAGNFVMGRNFLGKERGHHGNLELLIGGPAIRRGAKRATGDELSAAEALRRAEKDARLRPLADRVADCLAIAIIQIGALLDPEAVIFGGGTSQAGDWFLQQVRDRVCNELIPAPAMIPSVLGEDAQLHGAVFGALWELDPELALREELR